MVQCAVDHDKPVRIGVNAGSLDQELLNDLMETNASSSIPQEAQTVFLEAMVQSALRSAAAAEELGLKREQVVPPAAGAPPGQTFLNFWSLVLHPLEDHQPSKTGVYDEGLLVDNRSPRDIDQGSIWSQGVNDFAIY